MVCLAAAADHLPLALSLADVCVWHDWRAGERGGAAGHVARLRRPGHPLVNARRSWQEKQRRRRRRLAVCAAARLAVRSRPACAACCSCSGPSSCLLAYCHAIYFIANTCSSSERVSCTRPGSRAWLPGLAEGRVRAPTGEVWYSRRAQRSGRATSCRPQLSVMVHSRALSAGRGQTPMCQPRLAACRVDSTSS